MREVSCGMHHTVLAMVSGEVCTIGHGGLGQLGHARHGNTKSSMVSRQVEGLRV